MSGAMISAVAGPDPKIIPPMGSPVASDFFEPQNRTAIRVFHLHPARAGR